MNQIFRTKYHKSFFYNRLMEYVLMIVIGILMFFSLRSRPSGRPSSAASARAPSSPITSIPGALALVNNFFIQYLMPYGLTFLVLFTLYKFIPEVKVYTKGAAIAAAVAALFWEVFKTDVRLLRGQFLGRRHRPLQAPGRDADLDHLLPPLDLLFIGHPALGGGAGRGPEREEDGPCRVRQERN